MDKCLSLSYDDDEDNTTLKENGHIASIASDSHMSSPIDFSISPDIDSNGTHNPVFSFDQESVTSISTKADSE
ncbi:hypothetical protein ACJMK2_020570, partial [Sinanodonta woodiana]